MERSSRGRAASDRTISLAIQLAAREKTKQAVRISSRPTARINKMAHADPSSFSRGRLVLRVSLRIPVEIANGRRRQARTGVTAMMSRIALPAIGLLAFAISGCGNQLSKPLPGQTPQSINSTTPTAGQAGGPLVPANSPGAGSTLPVTQPGGGGAPLVQPNTPGATPDANTTLQKQQKSGYQPSPDSPLVAPSSNVR